MRFLEIENLEHTIMIAQRRTKWRGEIVMDISLTFCPIKSVMFARSFYGYCFSQLVMQIIPGDSHAILKRLLANITLTCLSRPDPQLRCG